MVRHLKELSLPPSLAHPFEPMLPKDMPRVHQLLTAYLASKLVACLLCICCDYIACICGAGRPVMRRSSAGLIAVRPPRYIVTTLYVVIVNEQTAPDYNCRLRLHVYVHINCELY